MKENNPYPNEAIPRPRRRRDQNPYRSFFHYENGGDEYYKRKKMPGNAAVIAPGTGLGEAGMYWDGKHFHPFASEGGHCDFSPRDKTDLNLLVFLQHKYGHVSWERLVSGPGIVNIFDFLRTSADYNLDAALESALLSGDIAANISKAATEGEEVAVETVKFYLIMFYTILLILHLVVGIGLAINLLLSGGRPTKTIAWLLMVFLVPFLGVMFYLMLGLNRRKYKFNKLKRKKVVRLYIEQANRFYGEMEKEQMKLFSEDPSHQKLSRLIMSNSKQLPRTGNKVTVLNDGPATFQSIFEALEKARRFIHLQYYIFEEGDLADRMADLFEQKIKEGVEIRMVYDGIGSRKLSRTYLRRLRKMGVQVLGLMPLRFGKITTTFNYRNHRKIIVVDGEVGFTGGINVSDKYLKGDPELGIWHDVHMRLEGPAVNSLHAVFAMDWGFVKGDPDLLTHDYFPKLEPNGDATVQIVASSPDSDFSSVRQQYFTLINQAKEYVYIANSYVIPGEAILEALQTAALSGVDVRLLIPEKSDNVVVKWSIRSYFQDLLKAGIRIYLYPEGFLHSKIIVSDDSITSIGTANMDIRSFEQNFEINAVIYDRGTSLEVKNKFISDCEKGIRIYPEVYAKRPWTERIKEGIGKIFSPVL